MTGSFHIRHLSRNEVDVEKWDACISLSTNGVVYAYSFYLDAMAENWDALILNNYEAVMPLPWKKKMGTAYLYQPFMTPQLGVFARDLDQNLFSAFLDAIPKKFRFWDLVLNSGNKFSHQYPQSIRNNFELSLKPSYDELSKAYRTHIHRNLKRASQYQLEFMEGINPSEVLALTPHLPQSELSRCQELIQELTRRNILQSFCVRGANGQLYASALFAFTNGRAFYLLVGNDANGRTLGASHLLIDGFIRKFAGSNLLLDFEGSDMSQLAFFYSSFGAVNHPYPVIRRSLLPWYLRWIKK